jgi:hypothetical protein
MSQRGLKNTTLFKDSLDNQYSSRGEKPREIFEKGFEKFKTKVRSERTNENLTNSLLLVK